MMKLHTIILLLPLLLAPLPTQAAEDGNTETEQTDVSQEYGSVEERRLLSALQEERITLQNEREELAERKKTLKRLEDEVDKKLDELRQQRIELEQLLADKDAQELKRIQDLSKMYEKMTADKAASIFSSLEQDLAVAILATMKTKSAARILNNMDRDKAAALTTAFSTLEP